MPQKLQSKNSVDKIIKTLSQRYVKRNGGYSRVLRAGYRYGDDAPMAIIELIDRDINAKKIDIKKKPEEKSEKEDSKKEISKKPKIKK